MDTKNKSTPTAGENVDHLIRHLELLEGLREITFIGEPGVREDDPSGIRSAMLAESERTARTIRRADDRDDFGCYVTLNSMDADYAAGRGVTFSRGRCKGRHIAKRSGVLIDVDAGQGKDADGNPRMATDDERLNAGRLAVEVMKYLDKVNWPKPLAVSTGNGVQLTYGCDLPAGGEDGDEVSRLIQRLLLGLAATFDGRHGTADVDASTGDLPRLCRLAGTMNRKGRNDPENGRPWRRTSIIKAPETLESVSLELLETTVAELDPNDELISPVAPREEWTGDADGSLRIVSEVVEALKRHGIDCEPHGSGLRLSKCPWCGVTDEAAILGVEADDSPLIFKCFHNSAQADPSWSRTSEDGEKSCSSRTWADLRRITVGPAAEWVEPEDALPEDADERIAEVVGELDPEEVPKFSTDGGDPVPKFATAGDGPKSGTGGSRSRPTIQVNGRQCREVYADGFGALQHANRPVRLVNFGGVLSRIDEAGATAAARPLKKGETQSLLADAADWVSVVREDGRPKKKPAKIPADVVTVVHDAPAGNLPRLEGITTTPVLLPSGRLLTAPGYDHRTGLYLDADGLENLDVPETPTPAEANAALGLLLGMVDDFPFVSEADRTNYLAMLLTPFLRPMIDGPTPLFALDATTPRTGKTLLANLWSEIVSGSGLPTKTAPREGAEWGKAVSAALLQSPAVVAYDNVSTTLQAGELAAALTERVHSCRILGESRTADVPVSCCWIATGNNLQFSHELRERTVLIGLDAGCEHPGRRSGFKIGDLTNWAKKNRRRLVEACLTICRFGLNSNHDASRLPRMGGFERWVSVVGGTLSAIGLDDLQANRIRLEERDAGDSERRAFVAAWAAIYGTSEVTAGELAAAFVETGTHLAESLPSVKNGKTVTALGYWLRKHLGTIIDGWKIGRGDGRTHGAVRWRLVNVSPAVTPPGGDGLDRTPIAPHRHPHRTPTKTYAQSVKSHSGGDGGDTLTLWGNFESLISPNADATPGEVVDRTTKGSGNIATIATPNEVESIIVARNRGAMRGAMGCDAEDRLPLGVSVPLPARGEGSRDRDGRSIPPAPSSVGRMTGWVSPDGGATHWVQLVRPFDPTDGGETDVPHQRSADPRRPVVVAIPKTLPKAVHQCGDKAGKIAPGSSGPEWKDVNQWKIVTVSADGWTEKIELLETFSGTRAEAEAKCRTLAA